MKSLKIFSVLFFFFSGINAVKADQWEDPNWREMIDSSDVIALVKYITNGSFRAKAQVLTVYKGKLNANDQIWISGFSNRYGPIDSMSIGETYLVFVTHARPTPKSITNLEVQLKEKPEMAGYIEALKAGTAYYVWTPTAGDLRVMENQVQYDLMQTTFYPKQPFHVLPEFEAFLRAAIRKEPSAQLSIKLLSLVQTNPGSKQTDQRLMMLYLTGYRQYHSVFQKVSLQKNISTRFALARLLGNIKTDRSRQLLIQLLNDKNGAVQGEAVRQLSNEPADYIGPVLVKRLQSSSKGVYGPTNIMDPVINTISGGQIEIIETLGKLKYKPAVPFLLPLLSTEDDYTFDLLVETLKSLGSTDYVPYLNRHLEKRTESLIFNICKLVTEDSLNQCVPSLMKYVATTDKTDHMSKEFTVSSYLGLAHFETDTVKRFLVKDFLHLLKNDQPRKFIDNRKKWVKEYIEAFTKLSIDTLNV